jgi:dolichol-phosphate mannosyltransferase
MKTLVVIPTYNEAENLAGLVERILALTPPGDILVVDDGSPDGTGQLADSLAQTHRGRLTAMHRSGKRGLGSAYIAGFRWGLDHAYEALCQIDADGSHDPEDLPRLWEAVRLGADLAIGSRRVAGGRIVGWNWWRHLMSWGAMTLSRMLLRLQTCDVTAGFRCYRAATARLLLDRQPAAGGYAFQEESLFLVERSGAQISEIPVTFRDRERGASKLGRADIKEFFRVLWRLLWRS